jgi:hypothetical protein
MAPDPCRMATGSAASIGRIRLRLMVPAHGEHAETNLAHLAPAVGTRIGPYGGVSLQTMSIAKAHLDRHVRSGWLAPVCYQDIPESLLPAALRTANPWRLPRRIDHRLVVAD